MGLAEAGISRVGVQTGGGLWQGERSGFLLGLKAGHTCGRDGPLVNVVCSKGVDPVNVRDVEDRLITGRVCGQFHQGFIQENGLKE